MIKKRAARRFDEEFRREAVRLAESGTLPIADVARRLGVHLKTLRNWRRTARSTGASREPNESSQGYHACPIPYNDGVTFFWKQVNFNVYW